MRYPASEKLEIIRIVEQSHLSARKTLDKLGIPRRPFYRWYDRYLEGGPEALADRPSAPSRVWNRIPAKVQDQIIDLALERSELSPRELAVTFTDQQRYFVSEATVHRLLKAYDLLTGPAYVLIKAANRFHTQTSRVNEMWQTGSEAERRRSRRTLYLLQDQRLGLDVSIDRAGRLLALHHCLASVRHDAGRGRD